MKPSDLIELYVYEVTRRLPGGDDHRDIQQFHKFGRGIEQRLGRPIPVGYMVRQNQIRRLQAHGIVAYHLDLGAALEKCA